MPSTAACSSSSAAWIWPPKAVFRSPPSTSTLSSACSFSIREATRRPKRIHRLARCSLNDESSPRPPPPADPGEIPSSLPDVPVRLENNKGEQGWGKFSFDEDERFTPLSRRPRFRLRSKSARKIPPWSRIFFASKKVRSIILLNVLTVIYASDIPVLKEVEAVMEPASFNMVGDILNILSAVFFGIHMLRTEHISRSTKKEKFMALLGYEVCTVAVSSMIWFLLKDIFGNVHDWNITSSTWSMTWDWISSFPWIPALYTGVFSTGFCLWAEMYAMNDVSATETAIVYGLEPVWGAAFAWFLLGERWGNTEWIGATLVLCGSLAVQILGSASEKSDDEISDNCIHLNASGKQNDFSLSAVVVNQRKNLSDLIRKQDKL